MTTPRLLHSARKTRLLSLLEAAVAASTLAQAVAYPDEVLATSEDTPEKRDAAGALQASAQHVRAQLVAVLQHWDYRPCTRCGVPTSTVDLRPVLMRDRSRELHCAECRGVAALAAASTDTFRIAGPAAAGAEDTSGHDDFGGAMQRPMGVDP